MIKLDEIWQAIEGRVVALIHKTEARGCRMYRSTAQTGIATSTWTSVSYTDEIYDSDGCSNPTLPTRLNSMRDGYYLAGFGLTMPSGNKGTYTMRARILRNGTQELATAMIIATGDDFFYLTATTGMILLGEFDYIEIQVWQNSGSDNTITAASLTGQGNNSAWLMRVG